LLALEKETLGTYLSSHPLSEVREALRARVDCSLADLANKPDGAWVTVGGIVAESKKIRTKSGNQMMFATLDDIEGQVEMLVFKADQAESAGAIETDAVVLVRGRIDHKDRGETKLVVQEAERFEPDMEEMARASAAASAPAAPLRLTIAAASLGNPHLIEELKTVFEGHRGDAEVFLAIPGEDGRAREWKLGEEFKVRNSSKLLAELDHVLGADALAA
jgi:DNA polymerase-3 subunit alpha